MLPQQSVHDFLFNNDFENQLKYRMALAQQQGMSSDQVNQAAMYERALQAMQAQQQAQQQQQQQPKQNDNFLTNLISPVAGIGGAVGGAALGTAILPGVGTIAGGILGGLLGGGGGDIAQQKLQNPNGNVDWGQVGLNAGLSAIPMGFGNDFKVARAAVDVGSQAAKQGLADRLGGMFTNGMLRKSTIAGTSTLKTAPEQQALIDLAQQFPQLRGSATAKFRNVNGVIDQLGNQVDQLFSGVDSTVPRSQFTKGVQQVQNDIVDPLEAKRFNIEFDRTIKQTFGGNLPQQLSPTDINALRRTVNGQMSGIYRKIQAGTTLTDRDNAFLQLKQVLDQNLTDLAPPEIKGAVDTLNKQQNVLINAIPEFKKGSEQGSLPVLGKMFGLGPDANRMVQAATDYAGRGSALAGRVMNTPVGNIIKKQAGTRLVAGAFGIPGGSDQQQQDTSLPANTQDLFASSSGASPDMLNQLSGGSPALEGELMNPGGQQQQQQSGGLQYSSVDLMNAAQQALMNGDMKSYTALANAASQTATMEKNMQTGGNGVDVAQQRDIASVKNAAGLLDALEQQFTQAGGGKGILGYANDIPVIGQYLNPQMGAYNQTKIDAATAYAKALAGNTGNGGSNQTLIEEVAKALPSATDTPEMAKQKLANLRQHLTHRLQTVMTYPYASSDLPQSANIISQLLGGGNQLPSDVAQLYGY